VYFAFVAYKEYYPFLYEVTMQRNKVGNSSNHVDPIHMKSTVYRESSASMIDDDISTQNNHNMRKSYGIGDETGDEGEDEGEDINSIQSPTSLASESRFRVDGQSYFYASLDDRLGGNSQSHQRWQHESPLAAYMANGSQRSTRSFDSCPEMPRRVQDNGMIRSTSMDMVSRFLVKKNGQTTLRDGGKSFYLNMVASNMHNAVSHDIDLYRPVGLDINDIRRRRIFGTTPAIDLHKPVGLNTVQDIRPRSYSFDMAPSLPTRSAPESSQSRPSSRDLATNKDFSGVSTSSYDQTKRTFQIANNHDRPHAYTLEQQIKMSTNDDDAHPEDDLSAASSQESDIPSNYGNLDIESDDEYQERGEYRKTHDSDSESDLSDDDSGMTPAEVVPPKVFMQVLSGNRSASLIQRKPDPDGLTSHLSPNRVQIEPPGSKECKTHRERSSEGMHHRSLSQDTGKQKWRQCVERSKAQRNSSPFNNVSRRSLSPQRSVSQERGRPIAP